MNKKEMALAVVMLDHLADMLGDNGCNDFDFPENWSNGEATVFTLEYHQENGDPEEYEIGDILNSDFCVARLLARKLEVMIK